VVLIPSSYCGASRYAMGAISSGYASTIGVVNEAG